MRRVLLETFRNDHLFVELSVEENTCPSTNGLVWSWYMTISDIKYPNINLSRAGTLKRDWLGGELLWLLREWVLQIKEYQLSKWKRHEYQMSFYDLASCIFDRYQQMYYEEIRTQKRR